MANMGSFMSGTMNNGAHAANAVAATVLCGDISLNAAIVADGWVTAHDELGRNRP